MHCRKTQATLCSKPLSPIRLHSNGCWLNSGKRCGFTVNCNARESWFLHRTSAASACWAWQRAINIMDIMIGITVMVFAGHLPHITQCSKLQARNYCRTGECCRTPHSQKENRMLSGENKLPGRIEQKRTAPSKRQEEKELDDDERPSAAAKLLCNSLSHYNRAYYHKQYVCSCPGDKCIMRKNKLHIGLAVSAKDTTSMIMSGAYFVSVTVGQPTNSGKKQELGIMRITEIAVSDVALISPGPCLHRFVTPICKFEQFLSHV